MAERLHRALARSGLGSRREMERWIIAGRVRVNGRPAGVGSVVSAGDRVSVDGRPVALVPEATAGRGRVLALNKPTGVECSRRPREGLTGIYGLLPRDRRWVPVGRLDVNTSGLLLATDDGALAHRLMHPRYRIVRRYAVRALGDWDALTLERLREGVVVAGERLRVETVTDAGGSGANHWFHVTLRQGRNREVRRLFEAVGLTVSRLIRIAFGPVTLPPGTPPGRHWLLSEGQVRALYELTAERGVTRRTGS